MKKLEMNQMENLEGGLNCEAGAQAERVLGAAVGGAIFFGFGFLATTSAMILYNSLMC